MIVMMMAMKMIVMVMMMMMMMMMIVMKKMRMRMMAMIMRIIMMLTFRDSCIYNIYRLALKQKMTAIQQIVEEKELTVKNNKDMIQGMYSASMMMMI